MGQCAIKTIRVSIHPITLSIRNVIHSILDISRRQFKLYVIKLQYNGRTRLVYFRAAVISLSKSYGKSIRELEENTKRRFNRLYIVGGGANNELLNRLTEKETGLKVIAKKIEATAIGNLKIQMEAYNEL